jgi:hypothetical protein
LSLSKIYQRFVCWKKLDQLYLPIESRPAVFVWDGADLLIVWQTRVDASRCTETFRNQIESEGEDAKLEILAALLSRHQKSSELNDNRGV